MCKCVCVCVLFVAFVHRQRPRDDVGFHVPILNIRAMNYID